MDNNLVNLLSLAAFVYYPSIPIILILAHSLISFWRRLGGQSYYFFISFFFILDTAALFLIWRFRENIFGWRFYDHPLALSGLFLILIGVIIGLLSIRALSFRVLMGLPEIKVDQEKTPLATTGIYKYLRHPRYLEFILELTGITFLSGLGANFILWGFFIAMMLLAIKLEEKELIKRFGQEYLDYMKKTPKFWPLLQRKKIDLPSGI